MKKISRLSASLVAGPAACLSWRRNLAQVLMVSFLVTSAGVVEAGNTGMARVIKLHLTSPSPAASQTAPDNLPPPPADNTVTVLSQKRAQGTLPRQRNPELSTQHLVIVGLNAQGGEISRTVMLDPRILRAETADPSGKLTSSELLYWNEGDFSFTIPDDPDAVALKIYKPRWTGTGFALDLIGDVNLPAVDHE